MIQNYDSSCVYEIYEIQQTGKKYKIGEIENNVFYDLNKKGKRLEQGYHFNDLEWLAENFRCENEHTSDDNQNEFTANELTRAKLYIEDLRFFFASLSWT